MAHSLTRPHRRARRNLVGLMLAALAARRERRALARLDSDRLRDIGLTSSQVRTEATRPIWNVPAHWLR
jgi:uncharacterized protein YjiS (DUF1127 family)